MITNAHTTAPQTLFPAGAPSQSERIALTVMVNGIDFRERPQNRGHRLHGHECGGDERQGKHGDESNGVGRLRRGHEHPEEREHPREGVAEQQQQPEAGHRLEHARVEGEADDQSGDDQD